MLRQWIDVRKWLEEAKEAKPEPRYRSEVLERIAARIAEEQERVRLLPGARGPSRSEGQPA